MNWDHVKNGAKAVFLCLQLAAFYYMYLFGLAKPLYESDAIPQVVTEAYQQWSESHVNAQRHHQ